MRDEQERQIRQQKEEEERKERQAKEEADALVNIEMSQTLIGTKNPNKISELFCHKESESIVWNSRRIREYRNLVHSFYRILRSI